MKKKMSFWKLALISVIAFCILSSVAISRMTFYSFSLSLPDEVTAQPGQSVTVEGRILVTGWYWLHKFELRADGIPYNYTIEPSYWQDVRILRAWNPEQGVYRVPENFTITIHLPVDAYGVHIVTITGQEHHSWRQVSNSTFFVLKIKGKPPVEVPEKLINVTDILVPETVKEGEPFNITFRVNNNGPERTAVAISILTPEDWKVEKKTEYLDIAPNDSAAGVFRITPTASAGTVSLYLEYPYKQEIINFTRKGPYLQPATTTTTVPTTTTTTVPKPFIVEFYESLKARIVGAWIALKEFTGRTLTPFTLGVIIVLIIIIVWLALGIVKDLRAGKLEAKKQTEQFAATNKDIFNGIDKL